MSKNAAQVEGVGRTWNIDQPNGGTKSFTVHDIMEIMSGNDQDTIVHWYECEGDADDCACSDGYKPDGAGNCVRTSEPIPELRDAASGFAKVVVESDCSPGEGAGGHAVGWVSSDDETSTVHLCQQHLPSANIKDIMALVKQIGQTVTHEWGHEATVDRSLMSSKKDPAERLKAFRDGVGDEAAAEAYESRFTSKVTSRSLAGILKKLGDDLDEVGGPNLADDVDLILKSCFLKKNAEFKIDWGEFSYDSYPEKGTMSERRFFHDTGFEPGTHDVNIAMVQKYLSGSGYIVADHANGWDRDWGLKSSKALEAFMSRLHFQLVTSKGRCRKSISECDADSFIFNTVLSGKVNEESFDSAKENVKRAFQIGKLIEFKCGDEAISLMEEVLKIAKSGENGCKEGSIHEDLVIQELEAHDFE